MEYLLGVIASLLVQWLKNKYQLSEYKTLAMVLFVSLIGAMAFVLLQGTPLMATLLKILEVAGAFYAFVLQRFPSQK